MSKLNVSGFNLSYENATDVTGVLFPALDITCDLYQPKHFSHSYNRKLDTRSISEYICLE